MRLYLAHPFPTRKRIRQWELRVEKKTGVELANPFYDSPRKHLLEFDAGHITKDQLRNAESPAELVSRDLAMLAVSDGIVAYVDGSSSIGTLMEIVYAHEQGLSVYIINSFQGTQNHPWLLYHATKMFGSLTQFTRWIGKQMKKEKSQC